MSSNLWSVGGGQWSVVGRLSSLCGSTNSERGAVATWC